MDKKETYGTMLDKFIPYEIKESENIFIKYIKLLVNLSIALFCTVLTFLAALMPLGAIYLAFIIGGGLLTALIKLITNT